MSAKISKSQFKNRVAEYLRQVETTGESLVITDHGKPTVEIRRYNPRDPFEILKGSVLWYGSPFEPVGVDDWEVLK